MENAGKTPYVTLGTRLSCVPSLSRWRSAMMRMRHKKTPHRRIFMPGPAPGFCIGKEDADERMRVA